MKLRLLLTACAVVGLLVAAAVAFGSHHRAHYASRVTIARATDPFHGRVSLKHPLHHPRVRKPCRTHRIVRLFWENNGGHIKQVGQTRSNRKGRWQIDSKAHKGRYFARVQRRTLPRRGGAVCLGAHSRRIAVSK